MENREVTQDEMGRGYEWSKVLARRQVVHHRHALAGARAGAVDDLHHV
ncbi:hypothetical protein [Streptomyces sp. NPDC056291]